MSEKDCWYGYLEAGAKSSLVVMDPALSTGNSKTLYLFNLDRQRILEYSRAVVESKLRPLRADERPKVAGLQAAYAQAKSGFSPRGGRAFGVPDRGPVARRRREESVAESDEYEEEAAEELPGLDWASADD